MSKKNYNYIFKIEASKKENNLFIVYRKKFSGDFEKIGIISVIPGDSYNFTSLKFIKSDELNYIREQGQKLAGIEHEKVQSSIFWDKIELVN